MQFRSAELGFPLEVAIRDLEKLEKLFQKDHWVRSPLDMLNSHIHETEILQR